MKYSNTYAMDITWQAILKDLGLSSSNILRRAGLPEDLLRHPNSRLNSADFYKFWESIGIEINRPDFPLLICNTIKTESFSPPIFAALSSPNLWVAMQRIAKFKLLVAPVRIDVIDNQDTVRVQLNWLENHLPPPSSLVVTELLFFVALSRMGTREPIQPKSVHTTHLPSSSSELQAYNDFLGVPLKKAASHQIVFHRSDAIRPFLTSNNELWNTFEPSLRMRLDELSGSMALSQRVRAVLLEALPSGQVSMDSTVRKLAMSKRTFQRQLSAEGLTYTKLLNETREDLARHYLQKTSLPANEISFLLGFEEPNSFFRAFRDWTGISPEQLRRQH